MKLCGDESPVLKYSSAEFALKGEDRHLVCPHLPLPACTKKEGCRSCWSVFMICDGHNGNGAPDFIKARLIDELAVRLPKYAPGYKNFDMPEGELFALRVRKALSNTFRALDSEWRTDKERKSGSTLTVVLTIGWLVTVANVGDSFAYLHCYGNKYNLTGNHRLSDNALEKERLEKAGVLVAGVTLDNKPPEKWDATVGPLRAWPGGLMMSRSIGDMDASIEVNPCPHIKQVVIPETGARLVLASDGLWDSLDPRKVLSLSKSKPIDDLARKIMSRAEKGEGGTLTDDTTIIVVDILCANTPTSSNGAMLPQHPETMKHKRPIKALRKLVGASWERDHMIEFISDWDSMDEFLVEAVTNDSMSFDDDIILYGGAKATHSGHDVPSRVSSSDNLDLVGWRSSSLDALRSRKNSSMKMLQKSLLVDDSVSSQEGSDLHVSKSRDSLDSN